MAEIGTMVTAEPAPKPAAVKPAAKPRRSGNHFNALPTHVPYTAPAPIPLTTAAKYNIGRESANELMNQPRPHNTPPTITTGRGPNLSTNQPSIGTNHVSVKTKIVN